MDALGHAFRAISKEGTTVNAEQFAKVLATVHITEPAFQVGRLFEIFDSDGSGGVDYRELLTGIARLRGEGTDALFMAFDIFDTDRSGFLTKDEVLAMIRNLVIAETRALKEKAGQSPTVDDDEIEVSASALESLFTRMDANNDGKISKEEFAQAIKKEKILADAIFGPVRHIEASAKAA